MHVKIHVENTCPRLKISATENIILIIITSYSVVKDNVALQKHDILLLLLVPGGEFRFVIHLCILTC